MEHSTEADRRVKLEISSASDIWVGGYLEGNPEEPLGKTLTYGRYGYVSTLYALYRGWIAPYVNKDTVVLELGPGGGSWTKAILNLGPKHIYALDILSAEHNNFWAHVGYSKNITYTQVKDFSLHEIPDASIDYFFTFGCLCHASRETITTYVENLRPKMKVGATGVMMIADYDKFNAFLLNKERYSILRALDRGGFRIGKLIDLFAKSRLRPMDKSESDKPAGHRWYHCGIDFACSSLENAGFHVVSRDIGIIPRDPVIHFET